MWLLVIPYLVIDRRTVHHKTILFVQEIVNDAWPATRTHASYAREEGAQLKSYMYILHVVALEVY